MSVFLFSFSLFVMLAGLFALRDIVYARQAASHGKETEFLSRTDLTEVDRDICPEGEEQRVASATLHAAAAA